MDYDCWDEGLTGCNESAGLDGLDLAATIPPDFSSGVLDDSSDPMGDSLDPPTPRGGSPSTCVDLSTDGPAVHVLSSGGLGRPLDMANVESPSQETNGGRMGNGEGDFKGCQLLAPRSCAYVEDGLESLPAGQCDSVGSEECPNYRSPDAVGDTEEPDHHTERGVGPSIPMDDQFSTSGDQSPSPTETDEDKSEAPATGDPSCGGSDSTTLDTSQPWVADAIEALRGLNRTRREAKAVLTQCQGNSKKVFQTILYLAQGGRGKLPKPKWDEIDPERYMSYTEDDSGGSSSSDPPPK